jgi:nicotinamidase-related amidase
MLENILAFAPDDASRARCTKWFGYLAEDIDYWPFGGSIHQQGHWVRTMLLSEKIGAAEGLSDVDLEALCAASAFHDTRRKDPFFDVGHGARGAEHYRAFCSEHNLAYDPRAYLAMRWHAGAPEGTESEGHADAPEGARADARLIYEIFKDADALDRFRMGAKTFDEKYLRRDVSHGLVDFSRELLAASHAVSDPAYRNKKLLVVVDVQDDFVDGALGTPEAVAALPNMVRKVHSWDGEIVFTKDTHTEFYDQCQEGVKLPVPHCIAGTSGWRLVGDFRRLQKLGGQPVYLKGTFGSVELADDIQAAVARGAIGSVELIGLCTDICVISNALLVKARVPQLPVSVDASCCAGVTPATHEAALAAMRSCQIEVH